MLLLILGDLIKKEPPWGWVALLVYVRLLFLLFFPDLYFFGLPNPNEALYNENRN